MNEGFTPTKLQEERDKYKRENITISMNKQQRVDLEEDKKVLEQPKDSTAYKQVYNLGRIVLHDDKIGHILKEIIGNRNRNKRLGIVEFD